MDSCGWPRKAEFRRRLRSGRLHACRDGVVFGIREMVANAFVVWIGRDSSHSRATVTQGAILVPYFVAVPRRTDSKSSRIVLKNRELQPRYRQTGILVLASLNEQCSEALYVAAPGTGIA